MLDFASEFRKESAPMSIHTEHPTILLVSARGEDRQTLLDALGADGFAVANRTPEEIPEAIEKENFDVIMADYDLVGETVAEWVALLHQHASQACCILCAENGNLERIAPLLQQGVYAFIPRAQLSERIRGAVLGALENSRAFLEILGIVDRLQDSNLRLEQEKKALWTKNRELAFLNRISAKLAYDLNWDSIVSRTLEAGISEIFELDLFGLLYRLGGCWNLSLRLIDNLVSDQALADLERNIIIKSSFLLGRRISEQEVAIRLDPPGEKSSSADISPAGLRILPLTAAGKQPGVLVVAPRNIKDFNNNKKELMSTMANILALSLKNAREYENVKEMAIRDALTGVLNYKGFQELLAKEVQRARRYKNPISLIMIDGDEFKGINDSFGHPAGDFVLCEIAACLSATVRQTDIVARYGGDEFMVLLPETGLDKAHRLARRIRRSIRNHVFQWESETIDVRISLGISAFSTQEEEKNAASLIAQADDSLYRAKMLRKDPASWKMLRAQELRGSELTEV